MEHSQQTFPVDPAVLKKMKTELTRFMMTYKFALDEMDTKINILQEEFQYVHDYNPIEHISTRLKSPESILEKAQRKKLPLNLATIRNELNDIAGIRINCSFQKDIYKIKDMLSAHQDLRVVEVKDYIQEPKENGYRSLHLIAELPVYMSDRVEHVAVEIQIRTVAMDFWASLEHKIFYKFGEVVPNDMRHELKEVADIAAQLDTRMEGLHRRSEQHKEQYYARESMKSLQVDQKQFALPERLLQALSNIDETPKDS
ncbi:GTP pyrophosphokinase [Bacillaceae bacterium JMAK1]|nr:GTP pyrophosphokinase [Bacillaceae bacterium JMAK1]